MQVFGKNSLFCRIYLKLNPKIWGIWIERGFFLRLLVIIQIPHFVGFQVNEILQSEESLANFEWKWVWAKDRTVCSANDKIFQPKSSMFYLPQFVAFIMFDILQTEEPTIGLDNCYSSDCRISKEIPHIVCFLPYLDPTIWGILSRFQNQAFLRLQVFLIEIPTL